MKKGRMKKAEADLLKAGELADIAKRLDTVCVRLEKTRSSFKSAAVADARKEIEQLRDIFRIWSYLRK